MLNYSIRDQEGRLDRSLGTQTKLGTTMIYTDQENEWLSTPEKTKRVSNQTADGRAPKQRDYRKHDWAITTTIEIDGVSYVMPVQV